LSPGIDLKSLAADIVQGDGETDIGRKAFFLRKTILTFQESFSVIEKVTVADKINIF
jgi:hypothetical protein